MREIKFRAWSKKHKRMSNAKTLEDFHNFVPSAQAPYSFKHVEFMQYTGLKDKNGIEIYEGDIVEIKEVASDNFTVTFKNGCFWVEFRHWEILLWTTVKNNDCEVIGNIYENPELLENTP